MWKQNFASGSSIQDKPVVVPVVKDPRVSKHEKSESALNKDRPEVPPLDIEVEDLSELEDSQDLKSSKRSQAASSLGEF